ncbi:hypothetical protein [uncultured Rikenella sp.]|uniref:hypothetical protein n=1 Tax=uncultured Rikenella sp. TaxID=368003 RepID=UPI00261AE1F7|nr:hypothetical protein [uncultured Rikenella sp.]
MKKVSILAAIALVVVGCNKRALEEPIPPVTPDTEAPVSFGATAEVSVVESKAALNLGTDLTPQLGVYAFKAASVPNASTADGAVWCSAKNLHYTWVPASNCYKEDTKTSLFWPASGNTSDKLSFASYFPYLATATTGNGVNAYVLTQDLATQTGTPAPDYGFAWAKAENVGRPNPMASQALAFNYKVAKVSLSIVGDGTSVGATGIKVQSGGTGEGVVSIKLYTASTSGLYKEYKLNLLDGTTTNSTGNLTQAAPMTLQPVAKTGNGTSGDTFEKDYVDAVGYLAPSTDANFEAAGLTVEVVYNDGTSDQTYTATIKAGVGLLAPPADLSAGLAAGNNYKYTLKLGKSGITFTGTVTDWTDVAGGEITLD